MELSIQNSVSKYFNLKKLNMLTINFSPFPILETERLLLRRVDSNDIKEIFALVISVVLAFLMAVLVEHELEELENELD